MRQHRIRILAQETIFSSGHIAWTASKTKGHGNKNLVKRVLFCARSLCLSSAANYHHVHHQSAVWICHVALFCQSAFHRKKCNKVARCFLIYSFVVWRSVFLVCWTWLWKSWELVSAFFLTTKFFVCWKSPKKFSLLCAEIPEIQFECVDLLTLEMCVAGSISWRHPLTLFHLLFPPKNRSHDLPTTVLGQQGYVLVSCCFFSHTKQKSQAVFSPLASSCRDFPVLAASTCWSFFPGPETVSRHADDSELMNRVREWVKSLPENEYIGDADSTEYVHVHAYFLET